MFGEDFGRRATDGAQPSAQEFLRAAVAEARAAGHAEGHAQGWAEGQAAARQEAPVTRAEAPGSREAALMARLDQVLMEFAAQWHEEARENAEQLARLLTSALAAAFPVLCARHGAAEIDAVVTELLPHLRGESEYNLYVAPENLSAMEHVLGHCPADAAKPRLRPDARLGPADLRLTWPRGTARRDGAAIWQRIADILAPANLIEPGLIAPKEVTHVD